jgi:hypothetical protein
MRLGNRLVPQAELHALNYQHNKDPRLIRQRDEPV